MQTNIQHLLDEAKLAQQHAHCPYSGFQVGAALIADNGKVYSGCNVENAAYPLGQCAEASAIGAMVSNGAKKISDILIVSPNEKVCPPCGGCRQKIQEFASASTQVHMADSQGNVRTMTMAQLLPLAFEMD